ncbi:energy transducer TonB [Bernardetia sp. OM2101]|uniref:energy transducer TonB n=1 Tax=Bernardetia sp. OM2101 TaxID=3344876 RepID=UPI0035D039F6
MKIICVAIFLSLFCGFSVSAQTTYGDYYFHEIENSATFEGGMDSFYKIVGENLRSVDDKVGRVFIQFLVDTTGRTSEFKVVKGISEKSDNEVLRLMKWMSENYSWKPRLFRGQKVKTRMSLPIVFKEETKIYTIVENSPIFEGGQDNFYKIVSEKLKLAENLTEVGTRVIIEFVIDTTGKMTDFKMLESNFSEKNNAGFLKTLEFINENYTWKPAIHKGEKVLYRMNFPIFLHFSE